MIPPRDDEDLPKFREFDPQKEGDPALTSTSYVARRLAARIGIPQTTIPPSIPVTGQHAIMRSRIGIRIPPTSIPLEVDSPARQRLDSSRAGWLWVAMACALAIVAAWWLGGR